ncbi:MAG: glycosyltransferase family 9 protein [Nitrospirae bacterium]|nr:glycosyltransferase family 9 protein [Nitrospirota bacterium]
MKNLKALKPEIKNILLIRRNNIGDMICAISVFKSIRMEFPNAHITVLADSINAGVVAGASFVNEVLVYKKGRGIYKNKYFNYWRLFRENKRKYDLVIGVKRGFSSTLAAITLISGARIRAGCMPDKWHPLQFCYNLPVNSCEKWRSLHQVDALLEFIKAIGIKNTVKDISIEIPADSMNKARDFLKAYPFTHGDRGVVVFNVSNNKPENTWPLHKFKELGNMLCQKYNAAIIISSAPADRGKAEALTKGIAGNAVYFDSPKIMDFAAIAAKSNLLVCGEGGAMHVGASVKTPTISLWGSKRPRKWMPYGERQFTVIKGEHVDSISAEDMMEVIKENNLL